ncbi:MAG: hypothetical protein LUH21_04245 [Clostridiales bacterium]|nr:hypothetical protein [Clostridiales bacterium]
MKNCAECPFFEPFFVDYEKGVGLVEKGKCHKWNEDEIWETRVPCSYADNHSIEALEAEAFDN